MTSTIVVLLYGAACGFAAAIVLLLYCLSVVPEDCNQKNEKNRFSEKLRFKEDLPSDVCRKLLHDAVRYLDNIQIGNDTMITQKASDETPEVKPSLYQIEQTFDKFNSASKDRAKQLKCLSSFTSDVGRAYASFAKDLMKISSAARSNIKTYDQQQGPLTAGSSDSLSPSEKIADCLDEWLKALSLCTSHLSNDSEDFSELMIANHASQVAQICDDFVFEEKKLIAEGSKLLNQLKDSLLKNEHLTQDREKWRPKVSAGLPTPSKLSVMGGMMMTHPSDESSRRALKFQTCEVALSENLKIVQISKSDFRTQMPKIFAALRSLSTSFFASMKMQLMKVADAFRRINVTNDSVTQRLKSQLSATSITAGASAAGEGPVALRGFENTLHQCLTAMTAECHVLGEQSVEISAVPPPLPTPACSSPKLNMDLESTACLAATAPAVLPVLPPSFGKCINAESCVWFNAFSGRIYRDAARSDYFHAWLLEKLTTQLNKGAKPGFIDEVIVERVTFGSTPPLLFNVKWSPPVVRGHKRDRSKETSVNKPVVHPGTDVAPHGLHPVDVKSSAPVPHTITTASSSSGSDDGGGVKLSGEEKGVASATSLDNTQAPRHSLSKQNVAAASEDTCLPVHVSPMSDSQRSANSSANGGTNNRGTGSRTPTDTCGGSDSDTDPCAEGMDSSRSTSDEDIECTADMAYRSGLKFTISTRLWCNWPRDRYASIPVTLTLDLVEITGRVRFGVTHSSSYFTFLEEPHTRFAVHSEVGGDSFKFKDIPKLSDYIVKKLKDFIARKFVDPSCHSFRLIWPRSWWPVDVQDQYTSASETAPSPAPPPAPTSTHTPTPTPTQTETPDSALLSPAPAGTNPNPNPSIATPIHGAAVSSRSSDSSEGTCDSKKSCFEGSTVLSSSATDPKTNSPALSVEEPMSPPADEVKARGVSMSAAAAALASFSSTTGWLREEVRRRGHPHPSQASTPPLPGQHKPAPKTLGSASEDLGDNGDLTGSPGPSPGPCKSPEAPVRPITAKQESKLADTAATHERSVVRTTAIEIKTGTKPVDAAHHGHKETKKDLIEKLFFSEPGKVTERDGDKEKSHSSIEHNWRAALDFANKNGAVIPHFLHRKPPAEAPKTHESASDESSHSAVAASSAAARKEHPSGTAPTALSPTVARNASSAVDQQTPDAVKIAGLGQLNLHSTPSFQTCSHNAEPKELVRGLEHREPSGASGGVHSAAQSGGGEDLGLALPLTASLAAAASGWSDAPNDSSTFLLRSGDKRFHPVHSLDGTSTACAASECRSISPFPGKRVETDASSQSCKPTALLALQPTVGGTVTVTATATGEGSRSPAPSPRSATASAGKSRTPVQDEEALAGKEKEKVSDKSEWLNKLGEATEKFQNKFSAFKSKRVLPPSDATSTTPPTSQAKTSHVSGSLLTNPFQMHVDVSKPTGQSSQQPQVFKSSLPELLVSTHSLPTIVSPVAQSPTSSHVVQKRDDTPHYRKVMVGSDCRGQREGNEVRTPHSRELFSPDHASTSDLRPRSVSDLSALKSGNGEYENEAMGRSKRALSAGTLDLPICNGLASAMSSNRTKPRGSSITNSSSSAFAPTSSRTAIRATMTPQERRYTMFRQLQSAISDNDTDAEVNEGLLNSFTPIEQLNELLKSTANYGAEVSPNAAVLAFEQQLTGAERSESSFSPGDHCAPAPSRLGVLHVPPSAEAMWAELSQKGKYGKAVLQLYFIGLKSAQGTDPEDTRKSVSFSDSTGFSPAPSVCAGTGTTQVHAFPSSGNSGVCAGAKMVLAASYDLQGAECRLLSSAATVDAAEGKLVSLFGAAPVLAGSPSLPPAAVGFQVLLRQDRGKWTTFLCSSEEECGDWMDAIDNAANP